MYRIQVTGQTQKQMEQIFSYIFEQLCNPAAAVNLLNEIEEKYRGLIENPLRYGLAEDPVLAAKRYRKIPVHKYVILYRVDETEKTVYIMGIFHKLENYRKKM